MTNFLLYIAVGVGGYYLYKHYNQPPTIDENQLIPISKLPHDKTTNPLYDPSSGQTIKIHHIYQSQVIPELDKTASHPYSTKVAYM